MTAPGLDAFVSWVEEHTKNNENNIAKLRDFLKGNYETYSSWIHRRVESHARSPHSHAQRQGRRFLEFR